MSSSPALRPCTAPAQWHVSLRIQRLACLGNVLAAWCFLLCSFVLSVGAMLQAHVGGTHPWLFSRLWFRLSAVCMHGIVSGIS